METQTLELHAIFPYTFQKDLIVWKQRAKSRKELTELQFQKDLIVWKPDIPDISISKVTEFQKDLIVWKQNL